MPDMIRDGKGRGYLAEVNADNLLETNAVIETTYAFASRAKGRAFVAASAAITTDGTDNNVFFLKNPSDSKYVVIAQIDVSCTTTSTVTINLAETYSAGGTGITPVNLNRASGNSSVVTNTNAYYGDDMTLGGTASIYSYFVTPANTPFREEILDAILLGNNDTISVSINAAAGTAYVSIKYHEVDV